MRWRAGILTLLLWLPVGCANWKPKPVVLPEQQIPVALKRGDTFAVPWDGWFMQSGTAGRCFDECVESLIREGRP